MVSDIQAGDGKTVNLFLQCSLSDSKWNLISEKETTSCVCLLYGSVSDSFCSQCSSYGDYLFVYIVYLPRSLRTF